MTRAVFWQNRPSIHQAALIRAVGDTLGTLSVVVIEQPLDRQRIEHGWTFPDYGDSSVIVAPSDDDRRHLERSLAGAAIHVFSGLGVYPATARSMTRLAAFGRAGDAVRLVFAEPWSESARRRAKYRLARLRYRGCVDGVLACGPVGVRQYRGIGFCKSKVLEFGYFLDVSNMPTANVAGGGAGRAEPFRVAFIGSLDARKRPDWVLRALSDFRGRDWSLDIVGTGPHRDKLRRLAGELGLGDRVRWRGVLPNGDVAALLVASDVLVLPSRHDGWGAVVNEALGTGTPVIVSDAAGASVLVAGSMRGSVFRSGSLEDLRSALAHHLDRGRVSVDRRAQIRSWAARYASAPVAAAYLLDVAESVRGRGPAPVPPWHA
jgi:glycosyltransferase involved in cell wall biosynthesis